MNAGWHTTIRTGDPNADMAELHRQHAHAQSMGLAFTYTPIAEGGFNVRAYRQGERCQACGRDAQTKQVTFMQNIGMIVLRFPKTISGRMCRFCIDKYFWRYTTVSMLLGWWGVISFFTTLVAIPMNLAAFLGSRGLAAPQHDEMSRAEVRSRSTLLVVFGAIGAFCTLAWLALAAVGIASDPDNAAGGVVVALVGLVAIGGVTALMLVSGIRGRASA